MSTGFRPLSTRVHCALELRDLNLIDTDWLAFNYYIYIYIYIYIDALAVLLIHVGLAQARPN